MNLSKSLCTLLVLLPFMAPTPAHALRVTTVETYYIEPERHRELEVWCSLISLCSLFVISLFADHGAGYHVQEQDDIELYSITVKIKNGSQTVDEATFSSSDYDEVIDEALAFARREIDEDCSLLFKPSITLTGKRHPQMLDTITKPRLPHKPEKIRRYWEGLDRHLTRLFIVPRKEHASEPRTHVHYVEHHHVTVAPQPWYATFWFY